MKTLGMFDVFVQILFAFIQIIMLWRMYTYGAMR